MTRAYHRVDPLMDERKSHYTPAQFGAFLKVQLVAGRQSAPGYFRSVEALRRALPGEYVRHVPFLIEQGDIVTIADGRAYIDGWEEWQEGDLTVGERMARLRNRKRNAAVTPPVTPTVTQPSPPAIGIGVSSSVGVSKESLGPPKPVPARSQPGDPSKEPRLTKDQLDGWGTFSVPAWRPFKDAWLARGFRHPPFGSPDDGDTSQRGLLWQIADARPIDLGLWVKTAPGHTAREVIEWVLKQWHESRDEAPSAEEEIALNAERIRNGRVPMTPISAVLPLVVRDGVRT